MTGQLQNGNYFAVIYDPSKPKPERFRPYHYIQMKAIQPIAIKEGKNGHLFHYYKPSTIYI